MTFNNLLCAGFDIVCKKTPCFI